MVKLKISTLIVDVDLDTECWCWSRTLVCVKWEYNWHNNFGKNDISKIEHNTHSVNSNFSLRYTSDRNTHTHENYTGDSEHHYLLRLQTGSNPGGIRMDI